MDIRAFEQTRSEQLSKALQAYEFAYQSYYDTLQRASQERDVAKRTAMIQTIREQNIQLVMIVRGIVQHMEKDEKNKKTSTYKDLQDDLNRYKKDVETLNNKKSDIQQLKEILNQTKASEAVAESYYFGYLIAILCLLLLVLVLFLIGGASNKDVGSALPEGPAPFNIPIKFDIK